MSRSSWKPVINNNNITTSEKHFIFKRNLKISENFINKKVNIYNGIRFFEILVSNKMIGFNFGEFSPTRKIPLHKKKKNKKKK